MSDFEKSQKEYRRQDRKDTLLIIFSTLIAGCILTFVFFCVFLNWDPL